MKKRMVFCLLFLLTACGNPQSGSNFEGPPATAVTNNSTSATQTAVSLTPDATLPPPPTFPPAASPSPVPTEAGGLPEGIDGGIVLQDLADFGDSRNMLTGELVDDPAQLQQRPLAVKISNAPPNFVRPQAGLTAADIIFEHTAEGSITRFTAIFYDSSPQTIGPIRSARLIDVELPAMYDAALAYSGASAGVNERLNSSDFQTRLLSTANVGYYRSGEDKPFEHTLYGNAVGLRESLTAKGLNTPPTFTTHNIFSELPPEGGQPASTASINYQWELVEWRYDAANGRYWRWADGQPILDANNGEQVSAANVIIIAPFHVEDPTICEEIANNTCRHLSVQIQLWGSGTGILLRDGRQYPVTWHREARTDSLTLSDGRGSPFPLQIGNIWVQLVPSWYTDPVIIQE